MTETEAIDSLTAEIMGTAEPMAEEVVEETPQATPEESMKIDVAKIFSEQTKMMNEQSKKIDELSKKLADKETPAQPSEEEMMVEQARQKLGIDMQAMEAAKQLAEERKLAQMFDATQKEFKKEFPDVDMKEMGKWAEENGLLQMLNSGDINQWRVVGTAMKQIAKAVGTPDPITPTAQKGAETTVWDRKQKGENVSDTELAADVLKIAGIL